MKHISTIFGSAIVALSCCQLAHCDALKVDSELLPNCHQLTQKVVSGGQPAGEAAFRELRKLGVRTIISVDGARPDVEAARQNGLRYVHLPHGYDGISPERIGELTKAIRDLPGPIYVHCHHGKHRSPAAAAAACVTLGTLSAPDGLLFLRAAGTSPAYRGLYQAVASARRLSPAEIDQVRVEFREVSPIAPVAQSMVAIEHTHDHLKLIAEAGWKPPADHPDLAPAHEALLLREHFTELLRIGAERERPQPYSDSMRDAEAAARELESALEDTSHDRTKLSAALSNVTNRCKTCHERFRDVPLRDKIER